MKRPTGVTILGVIAIIGGVLQILGWLGFFGMKTSLFPAMTGVLATTSTAMLTTIGVVSVLLGVVAIVVGFGALGLRSWAWTSGVTLFGIDLVFSVAIMLLGSIAAGTLVSALVSIVALAYLYTHDVRQALGHLPSRVEERTTGQTPHPV
jgi:hypothetical protein